MSGEGAVGGSGDGGIGVPMPRPPRPSAEILAARLERRRTRRRDTTVVRARSVVDWEEGKLLSIIGDEDTVVGFLLGGIGDCSAPGLRNYFVVYRETSTKDIEEELRAFATRQDIAIILITELVAERIRSAVRRYQDVGRQGGPVVLLIPSAYRPYDTSTDKELNYAKKLFNNESSAASILADRKETLSNILFE